MDWKPIMIQVFEIFPRREIFVTVYILTRHRTVRFLTRLCISVVVSGIYTNQTNYRQKGEQRTDKGQTKDRHRTDKGQTNYIQRTDKGQT